MGSQPGRSSALVSTGHASSCRPASGWRGSWPRISAHWLISMLRKEREERCYNIDETAAVKSAVQFSLFARLRPTLVTLCTAARQASLSITNSQSLLKLMSIESVMPSNHLILCRPLLLLPSIFPRIFSTESVLHIRWSKYWSFSFSISLSNEDSGLISFKTDGFDLLAVHGTLKSLLQRHSLKASILQHAAFFMVQFLYLYMMPFHGSQPCHGKGACITH